MIIRIEYFVSLGKSQLSFCCHCLVAGPPLTNLSLPWIISRKRAIIRTKGAFANAILVKALYKNRPLENDYSQ